MRGHEKLGHKKLGHEKLSHQKLDHEKLGHNKLGHNKLGPLTFFLALAAALISSSSYQGLAMMPTVKLGDQDVKLEVAQTDKEIQQGLMFRTSLPETQGMVFLFKPPRPVAFWMYNCFINLDMLFVKDGKIVKISHDVPPCKSTNPDECPRYPSEGTVEVSEVIEVAGGYCKRHGVKEGDTVNFDFSK
jgi:uncharacterized membrane protein (UPF0127 family)